MTRRLALPERQVTALCKGAAKAGYAPIVQIGNVFVRLVPENQAIPPQPNGRVDGADDPETFSTFDEYREWRERNRAGGDQGHP